MITAKVWNSLHVEAVSSGHSLFCYIINAYSNSIRSEQLAHPYKCCSDTYAVHAVKTSFRTACTFMLSDQGKHCCVTQ